MSKTMAVNAGSSSLKFQLLEMPEEKVITQGMIERIGMPDAVITIKYGADIEPVRLIGAEEGQISLTKNGGQKYEHVLAIKDHHEAIDIMLQKLSDLGIIKDFQEITGVGHRVVAGGEWFNQSVVVTDEVLAKIDRLAAYAPLHNPANAMGIRAFQKLLPHAISVAVFDTSFHQTMPEKNYLYSLPYEYYARYGARKYGAHGTSHMYVSQRLAEIENKNIEDLKIVTCHLGQGSSICAVDGGKSIDTSMGLTPLGGIPMVTRSGDLDPSVLTYLMKKENISAAEMENILNKKSGVAGISGLAPDFRVIELESYEDNERAKIAMESFKYAVASYIAKYAVAMNGIDYIVFTGGIGENQINIRKGICEKLTFMGVDVDADANNMRGEEKVISKPDSKVKVYVIPTNEELMIAKETQRLVK